MKLSLHKLRYRRIITPIFIISFNREEQLERVINSYAQLKDTEVVIHDNGSDNIETVGYLEKLEKRGITVNRFPKIKDQIDLNKVNESIERYFSKHKAVPYIVTDPDIELLPNAKDTVEVYKYFLKKFKDIESVGPMLKIDDIPKNYPLYNETINRHVQQFWQFEPKIMRYKNEDLAYLPAAIDTTFSMHRANSQFKRLTKGIRLYGEYAARHLDWYDPLIFEKKHYENSSSSIAHWSNKEFYKEFKSVPLKFEQYYDVEQKNNRLEIIKRKTS